VYPKQHKELSLDCAKEKGETGINQADCAGEAVRGGEGTIGRHVGKDWWLAIYSSRGGGGGKGL